jgi:hypothetical protein
MPATYIKFRYWAVEGLVSNRRFCFLVFVNVTFIEPQGTHMVDIYQPSPPFTCNQLHEFC